MDKVQKKPNSSVQYDFDFNFDFVLLIQEDLGITTGYDLQISLIHWWIYLLLLLVLYHANKMLSSMATQVNVF
jgi:hypothetical protein